MESKRKGGNDYGRNMRAEKTYDDEKKKTLVERNLPKTKGGKNDAGLDSIQENSSILHKKKGRASKIHQPEKEPPSRLGGGIKSKRGLPPLNSSLRKKKMLRERNSISLI